MIHEACMFLCEAMIFICSILIVVWDMVSTDGMEGYEDMPVYTVLCSISTFCALAMTLSMLLVPTHVRSFTTGTIPLSSRGHRNAVVLSRFLLFISPIFGLFRSGVYMSRFGALWKRRELADCCQLLLQSFQLPASCGHQGIVQIRLRLPAGRQVRAGACKELQMQRT
jgi:hypothetical protein